MDKLSSQLESHEPAGVSQEQQSLFRRGMVKLLGINALSFGFSVLNEVVIGHSALGFGQTTMEMTDTLMAGGLEKSHRDDVKGRHERASRWRKGMYYFHIATAGVGGVEAMRLINEQAEVKPANIAISGIVGVLNARYIHHELKHRRHVAHTQTPDMDTAFDDPIEVLQDELYGLPDAATLHKLNHDGTIAIAKTNAVEAAGGVLGSLAQLGFEQGGAVAAVASSAGVIAIMGSQIVKERHTLSGFNELSQDA